MIQGDILTVKITDISIEGSGIAHTDDGFVLFVPDALPEEVVQVRVTVKKKSYGTAKILKTLTHSDDRVQPICPSFGRCGGCQTQHLSYTAQLDVKTKIVKDALKRIGGFEDVSVSECRRSPQEVGYRNKASIPVQRTQHENITAGFYKPRSHDVVPFRDCPILMPEINEVAKKLITALENEGFRGANCAKDRGMIRNIVIRHSQNTNDSLCCIIANRAPNREERERLRRIAKNIGMTGMSCNINDSEGNFIWGAKNINIFGSPTMTEKLGVFTFTFEASSFFQVNTAQAENLYEYASSLALSDDPRKILELYAGTGTLSAYLARTGASITSVESWQPAAKYIAQNARANGITTITPRTAPAEDIADELACERYDTVVLDPPRSGCDPKVISAISKISPDKIVYVSCNPATLARDAKLISASGYRLISAAPFDMFPQTSHVESVVLLTKVHN
ncbi:MAG: 23S rRNA (uracil(1939)-C(5))-methyltransferase RlmD [Synergistes sp.]|nr:23S rRNA (uracil(1939)-C(5))-methyltransferase RlmD [Synergistes sp.]